MSGRIVLVKSCQRFEKRRIACADTWAGQLIRAGHRLYFVEGGHERPSLALGMIRVTTGDAYNDNSIKLRSAIEALLEMHAKLERLFVCDDDTFVHPRRWAEHEPAGELECRIFRPKTRFENDGHGWIHGGGGWWMGRKLCQLYVEQCVERTSADDILMANIARENGIDAIDRSDLYAGDRYSGESDHRVAADNDLMTCHHVQPSQMRKLYEATREL